MLPDARRLEASLGRTEGACSFPRGIVPNPEAFVGVLVSFAASREYEPEMEKAEQEKTEKPVTPDVILGNFVQDMANGSQVELAWLKGFIFATLFSIPAVAGFEVPSEFRCQNVQFLLHHYPVSDVVQVLSAMAHNDCQSSEVIAFLDGLVGGGLQQKEMLQSLALAALTQGDEALACRGASSSQGGPPCLEVKKLPLIRLVTGFKHWCGHARGSASGSVSEGKPLIQRLFARIVEHKKKTEPDPAWLERFAWELAKTKGTIALQAAARAASREVREVLLDSIEGNILAACQHPHANYALQEYMRFLPYDCWRKNVLGELKGHCVEAAKNGTGCRVLQRLIEHITAKELDDLAAEVINDRIILRGLVVDKFGNYVVQHFLEHTGEQQANEKWQQRVVNEMCRCDKSHAQSIHELARHRVASHVVDKALTYCQAPRLAEIVEAMVENTRELTLLAGTQYGSFVFKHLQRVVEQTLTHGSADNRSTPWGYRCSLFVKALNKYPSSQPILKLSVKALTVLQHGDGSPPKPSGFALIPDAAGCGQSQNGSATIQNQAEREKPPTIPSSTGCSRHRRRRKKTAQRIGPSNSSMPYPSHAH